MGVVYVVEGIPDNVWDSAAERIVEGDTGARRDALKYVSGE